MNSRDREKENGTLSPDFLDFIRCLNEKRVDVVLIGGYALGVHGVLRATGDIDFLYRQTPANVRRLCAALIEFGAPPVVIDLDTLLMPEVVTHFGQPPFRIDLLGTIDGVTFTEVWAGAATMSIEGQSLRVIGLQELRKNKSSTGRKKDADDVRKLRARRTPKKR